MSFMTDVRADNFQQAVIDASYQQPVVVDFWASWCQPCKILLPIMEKLAEEYTGQFHLAKVEIDQQQELAAQFAVRSVPTVKMVVNGEVVDEFTGALPEDQVRQFINKHLGQAKESPLQKALQTYQQGDAESALQQMQQVLLDEPDNPMVRIEFANMLMREKRFDDARDLLNSLSASDKQNPTAVALFTQLEAIDAVKDAPDIDALLARIEQDPADCEAREQLSAHYKLRGDYAAAIDQLLEIVKRDRGYGDDAGRKALLKIFDILGTDHELVSEYRRKLARVLN